MKIKVTQEDINNGTQGQEESCPIALAVRRKRKLAEGYVSVGDDNISVDGGDTYELPEIAQTFIQRFDVGESVHPIEFKAKKQL